MSQPKKKSKAEKKLALYQQGQDMLADGKSAEEVCVQLDLSKAQWLGLLQKFEGFRYRDIYELSKKFGPPKINLRDARLADSYFDDVPDTSDRPIFHQVPENVTKEDFEYYQEAAFGFMEFRDLIFYLYPIALEFDRDPHLPGIDSFLFSLDHNLNRTYLSEEDYKFYVNIKILTPLEHETLKEALVWIWDSASEVGLDVYPNLQKIINRSGTFEP